MTAIDTTHAHAAGPAGVQPLRAETRPSTPPNLHLSVACPASGLAPLRERVEQKYFVPPGRQMAAFALLRRTCRAEAVYPVGQVNSLYFDTPDLDQHERSLSGEHAKDKVRIRWYGEEHDPHRTRATGGVDAAAARRLSGPAGGCQDTVEVWLELKSRRGFASTKQRLALPVLAPALAFPVLGRGVVSSTTLTRTMAGFGFIPGGPLRPVVAISYWRYRFVEPETGFRISIDSHIRSSLIMPGLGRGEREVELPGAVVEVKGPFFHLPRALRPVADIGTSWTRYSKYSSSLEAHETVAGGVSRTWPSGMMQPAAGILAWVRPDGRTRTAPSDVDGNGQGGPVRQAPWLFEDYDTE